MIRYVPIVVALGALIAWLAMGAARAETELEGTWIAHNGTLAGEAAPQLAGHRLSFEGDRFQITKEGELLFGGSFAVDATMEPPTIQFDQNETERLAGVWLGIYELVGDTLTICDNAHDMARPRPKGFDECSAAGYILINFTRQANRQLRVKP